MWKKYQNILTHILKRKKIFQLFIILICSDNAKNIENQNLENPKSKKSVKFLSHKINVKIFIFLVLVSYVFGLKETNKHKNYK